jgi:uncharacterized membrane protein YeaQ/YmgE (transglycosylase-associated protein family)
MNVRQPAKFRRIDLSSTTLAKRLRAKAATSTQIKTKPRGKLVKIIQTDSAGPVMLPLRQTRGGGMHMSSESLLVVLFVGLVAGWLAGQFVQGTGFGLVGDLVVGLLGALIGSWLLPQLGIHLGTGLVSAIVNATIGAVLLLLVVRLVRGGGGWQRSWWRR